MNMQDFSAAYNQTVRAGVQKITSFGSVSDGNAEDSSIQTFTSDDFNNDFTDDSGSFDDFSGDFSDDFEAVIRDLDSTGNECSDVGISNGVHLPRLLIVEFNTKSPNFSPLRSAMSYNFFFSSSVHRNSILAPFIFFPLP